MKTILKYTGSKWYSVNHLQQYEGIQGDCRKAGKIMKWTKFREPLRMELIHDCDLESDGKFIISASKENPAPGTVTHYGYKKIGRNNVRMHRFSPDIAPDKCWEFSSNWLRRIKS